MTKGLQGAVGDVPIPSIGQALRIRMSEQSREIYQSRLVEASSEHLFIDVPLHVTDRTSATAGPTIWVEFHAQDGAVCHFQANWLGSERMPATVWKISRPRTAEVTRDQRREFVRVSVDLPVRMDYRREGGTTFADIHTRDISGGGLSVLLPRHVVVRAGMMIDVKFTLPNGGFPVDVKCLVIRVGERNEFGIAACSLQFVDIKESIRQRIIQFVFWKQRMST